MVIIRLSGGLGNQMFQYATAKALALKNGDTLLLDSGILMDRSIKNNYTNREMELDIFGILDSSAENPFMIFNLKKRGFLSNLLSRLIIKWKKINLYFEPSLKFEPSLLELSGNIYLNGYFQSENYFSFYRNEIIEVFRFPSESDENNIRLKEEIKNNNSVSIHVRRGDYANNKHINSVHGLLALSYYEKAIHYLQEKFDDLYFYIFSDDAQWVKQHFKLLKNYQIIDHNSGDKSYVDMQLMSLCKHNIIANSSFSWWGAWLNQNPEKVVIGPKQWFLDQKKQENDIMCDSWVRI